MAKFLLSSAIWQIDFGTLRLELKMLSSKSGRMSRVGAYKFLATSHLAPQLRFSRSQIFLMVAKKKFVGI